MMARPMPAVLRVPTVNRVASAGVADGAPVETPEGRTRTRRRASAVPHLELPPHLEPPHPKPPHL